MSIRKNILTAFFATVLATGLAACGSDSTTRQDIEDVSNSTYDQRKIAEAKDDAKKAMDDAKISADAARAAARDAKASYDLAVDARTNIEEAEKQYNDADNAADIAEEAAEKAKNAYETINADGSVSDAEDKRDDAVSYANLADTQRGYAEDAENKAERASKEHVLGLLKSASAVDVIDDTTTMDVNEHTVAMMAAAAAIGGAAGSGTDRDNNSLTSDGSSAVAATANWAANTPAAPDADPPTAEIPMHLSVTITGVGANIVSDTMGTDANNDGDTADSGDTAPNARSITGLPGFMSGFDITDSDRHVLVFTDKKQATLAVPAKSTTVANHQVQLSRIKERPTSGTDNTPIPVTGTLTDLGSQVLYDHDGDPNTLAIMGSFSCQGAADTCALQVTDGELTAIEGDIRFSTTAAQEIVAAVPANLMNDYLVFGVWLNEADSDSDATNGVQPSFGAFASGGSAVTSTTYGGAEVTGTATYNGAAAGVYTAGSGVDYFEGDATLTADFGTPGTEADPEAADDELGTITGMIDNIVAGGKAMDDVIYLNDDTHDAANITAAGGFSGDARMGASETADDTITYPYNGSWSGQFYNGTEDDSTTTEVDEKDLPPGALVGTFGVTGTDDMGTLDDDTDDVTRSYVGGFGAHCSDCD